MSRRSRNRLLSLWLATLAVLLVLAAALPGLTLLPERNYDIPWAVKTRDVWENAGWLFSAMLALYVLGFLAFTPRELRQRLAYALVALWLLAGLIVLAVWLAGDQGIPAISEPVAVSSVTATPESMLELVPEVDGPLLDVTFSPPLRWVRVLLISTVILLCIALVLGILWFVYVRNRSASPQPLAQLVTRAQAALDALYGGEDVRDVVLRCYFEMAWVLDQSQGIRRAETATTREFAARLAALGLPAEPVDTLTRLFEDVRYGSHPVDNVIVQRAIVSLEAIVAALEIAPGGRQYEESRA